MNIENIRIQIPTKQVISTPEVVSLVNENSESILNQVGSSIAQWNFEKGQGLSVVNQFIGLSNNVVSYPFFSNDGVPYYIFGHGLVFILYRSPNSFFLDLMTKG